MRDSGNLIWGIVGILVIVIAIMVLTGNSPF